MRWIFLALLQICSLGASNHRHPHRNNSNANNTSSGRRRTFKILGPFPKKSAYESRRSVQSIMDELEAGFSQNDNVNYYGHFAFDEKGKFRRDRPILKNMYLMCSCYLGSHLHHVLSKHDPHEWWHLFRPDYVLMNEWDSNRALWILAGLLLCYQSNGREHSFWHWEETEDLFARAAFENDLRILKFTIDYMAELKPVRMWRFYFREHRLSQLPNANDELKELVNSIEAKHFDGQLCEVLCLPFSDHQGSHPFRSSRFQIREDYPICYNHAILLASFLSSSKGRLETMDFPADMTVEIMAVLKGLFDQFKIVRSIDSVPLKYRNQWMLVNSPVKDEGILQRCFVEFSWERPQVNDYSISPYENVAKEVSFLVYVYERWPKWLLERTHGIAYPLLLGLAWKHVELSNVLISPQVTDITLLIPPGESYSFEKAEYLEELILNYGHTQLQAAMIAKGSVYGWRDFFILGMVAFPDTPMNWHLVAKCFPRHSEDVEPWVRWMLQGRQPNPDIIERIGEGDLNLEELFALLFPEFASLKEEGEKGSEYWSDDDLGMATLNLNQ